MFFKVLIPIIVFFFVSVFIPGVASAEQIIIDADASAGTGKTINNVAGVNIDKGSQANLEKFVHEIGSDFLRIKLWTWQINENLDNYFVIDNIDLSGEIKANADLIHANGGTVLLQIYGMPKWLSTCNNSKCSETISNNVPEFSKYPPRDYQSWQKLVEKLVTELEKRNIKIDYYEIYGEPNLGSTWWGDGSIESIPSFLEHYHTTAKSILNGKPDAKIGGPAFFSILVPIKLSDNCASDDKQCRWVVEFVNYVKKNKSPFDFFSWHLYSPRTDIFTLDADSYSAYLKSKGLDVPIFLTEWNINAGKDLKDKASTHYGSSFIASSLMEIIESKSDKHNYYNLSAKTFGLFNGSTPKAAYNAFKMFSMLTGEKIRVISNEKPYTLTINRGSSSFKLQQKDIRAIGARDDRSVYLLVTYYLPVDSVAVPDYDLSKSVKLAVSNVPFSKYGYEIYAVDKNHSNSFYGGKSELEMIEKGNGSGDFEKQMRLDVYGTVLIKLTSIEGDENDKNESDDIKENENNHSEMSDAADSGKIDRITNSAIDSNSTEKRGFLQMAKNKMKSFRDYTKKFFWDIKNGWSGFWRAF